MARHTACRRILQRFQRQNLTENYHNYRNKSGYKNSPKTPGEPGTTQEPGAYPAIRIQEYRDGPTAEIAFYNERMNRIVENKATRNRLQEENVRYSQPGNPYKGNGGRPRRNRSTKLTGRKQAASTARRLKAGSATSDTPLANNYGRRPNSSPKKPALRCTKRPTFWPPRKKQDVQ